MKIVFVNRFFFPDHSATSQLLTDLACFLAGRGFAVHVVTSRQRYDAPAAGLPAAEQVQGVVVHRVWTSRFGRGWLPGRALDYFTFYMAAGWTLLRILAPGDTVVAKTDPPLISVVAGWAARRRKTRLVNWLQDIFPEVATALGVRGMNGPVAALLRKLRDASLRGAGMNVVLGRRMAQYVVGRGVAPSRVRVIPNWADGEAIRPLAVEDNPLRTAWGLDGKFVVGYSGNMGRVHEFGTVLDAAERLRDAPDILFLFIGDGRHRPWLEAEVKSRRLANVLFKSYQPREALGNSLALPDVHLITLRPEVEGFVAPSKFYGIAAAGKPTVFVGDPAGEIGALVTQAKCGVAIREGDPAGLAQWLTQLAQDPKSVAEMGARARVLFEERFERRLAFLAWEEVLAQ